MLFIELDPSKIIYGPYVEMWCQLEYPGHKNGCDNYLKNPDCPPLTKPYYHLIAPPYYFGIHRFNVRQWIEEMQEKHPSRSEAQCRIPYLWQSKQNKVLEDGLWEFGKDTGLISPKVLTRPEKYYVNIFSTCRLHKIDIDKHPNDEITLVGMMGKNRLTAVDYFK